MKTKKVAKAAVDFLVKSLVFDIKDRTLVKEFEMDHLEDTEAEGLRSKARASGRGLKGAVKGSA